MRSLVLSVGLSIGAAAALAGAGVWETKPFITWSDKEVQQVLADSPWSKAVQVVMNTVGRGGDAEIGRGGGGASGAGAETEGGGRGGRGGGFPTPAPQLKLLVSWRSARPMKQALVRSVVGLGGTVSPGDQEVLDRDEAQYVITMTGLPARFAGSVAAMKTATFLKRGNKPPIAVSAVDGQQAASGIAVVFEFPKDDAIQVDEKDVEFVTKLGQFDVKKKFNLKDMLFHGKLEL